MIKHNNTNKNVKGNFWYMYLNIFRKTSGYKYCSHEYSNNITKFSNSELADKFTRTYN